MACLLLLAISFPCFAIDPNQSLAVYSSSSSSSSFASLSKPEMAVIISNIDIVKKYPTILEGINQKIEQSNTPFHLVANQKIMTQFMEFLEDNNINDPKALKKADIADFGRKHGYPNVAVLTFNQVNEKGGTDSFIIPWSKNKVVSAEMVAKIINTDKGSYIYRNDIVKEVRSSQLFPIIFGSGPSSVNAWLDAVDQCTQQFLKDLSDL